MRCFRIAVLIAATLFAQCPTVAHAEHAADTREPFGLINLSELLRVIQFYNTGGLHCAALPEDSEDGFLPGAGIDQDCAPHDSDYFPQDWVINLAEILRLIQFYNSIGYSSECGTEDNFAPTPGELFSCAEGEGAAEGEEILEGEGEGGFDGEGLSEGTAEGEGAAEGEDAIEGEGATEGELDGEGMPDGEGAAEGMADGEDSTEGEGVTEGEGISDPEGSEEGEPEGITEGEGAIDGEGGADGEGAVEGEGTTDGEGNGEGEGAAEGEGSVDGEGDVEGAAEGEGSVDGEGGTEGEGALDGEGDAEGEGATDGEGAAEGEGEPCPVMTLPYPRARVLKTFNDSTRGGRSVPVEIYYPGLAEADNVAVAGPECLQFPVVVFLHGYQTDISHYEYLRTTLPNNGYIFVMVDTYNDIGFDFPDYGVDGSFIADALQAEGANPASIFFGKVSDKTALMGHSMGGGAAVFASGSSPVITTMIGLAPSAIDGNVITAAPLVTVPSLILGASKDCIVPAPSHAIPIYNGLASGCKHYVEIVNGSHCGYSDNNPNICNLGQTLGCFGTSFLNGTTQRNLTMLFLLPWLEAQLKGDQQAYDTFLLNRDAQQSSNTITTTSACP